MLNGNTLPDQTLKKTAESREISGVSSSSNGSHNATALGMNDNSKIPQEMDNSGTGFMAVVIEFTIVKSTILL